MFESGGDHTPTKDKRTHENQFGNTQRFKNTRLGEIVENREKKTKSPLRNYAKIDRSKQITSTVVRTGAGF